MCEPSPVQPPLRRRCQGMWLLAALLVLSGCAGLRELPAPSVLAGPGPVPPRYEGSLRVLSTVIKDGLDDEAKNMIQRLQARLVRDRAQGMLDLQGAQAFVDGCSRVLEGRLRVQACSFELLFRRTPGKQQLALVLQIRSRWAEDLVFLPGGVQVTVERSFIETSGEMVQVSRRVGLPDQARWPVNSGTTSEINLGNWPVIMAKENLASRLGVGLKVLAPQVIEGGAIYSAGGLAFAPVLHVELAGFLPTQALAPEDLLPAVLDPTVGIHGLIERVVRLGPSRYGEAERALVGLIVRATDVEISARIAPAVRWITRGACPGSDPREWRLWAREFLAKKSSHAGRSMLDLPRR